MKTDPLPRRLVAFRKIIPAVLLLGLISIGAAPAAHAQLTITLTENAAQTEVTVIFAGSMTERPFELVPHLATSALGLIYTGPGPAPRDWGMYVLAIDGASGAGTGWTLTETPFSFFGVWPAMSLTESIRDGVGGFDYNEEFDGLLSLFATASGSEGALTWSGSATFLTTFETLGVTVGDGTLHFTHASLDDVTIAVSAVTHAVPEPSTYAALAGMIALAAAAILRRPKRV